VAVKTDPPLRSAANAPASPNPTLAQQLEATADVVLQVRSGRSLTDALARCPAALRPGVQALSFLVMRRLGSADWARARLAPRNPPPPVDALLVTALALLWPDEQPPYADHTLVDQAVTAARRKAPRAADFVNAVLRRFVRERADLAQAALDDPVARWNHPAWWIERLRLDWPDHWEALLAAAQERPPMTLRVNPRRWSGDEAFAALQAAGLAVRRLGPLTLVLDSPVPVDRVPGFAEGRLSVQDAAAQRAAPLLLAAGLPAGARVLDACAAPGGKTAHLLELADLDVLAIDSDRERLTRVDTTLRRLGLGADVRLGDGRRPDDWWDGRPFDAILLDAPCSASGVVRRHPDIRWLRRAEDIPTLARTQAQLLDALWPTLRPGGVLVYATCSLFKEEGALQIDAFLQRHSGAEVHLDDRSPGHLLPLPDNGSTGALASGHRSIDAPALTADGFYYALLHKRDVAGRG